MRAAFVWVGASLAERRHPRSDSARGRSRQSPPDGSFTRVNRDAERIATVRPSGPWLLHLGDMRRRVKTPPPADPRIHSEWNLVRSRRAGRGSAAMS